MLDTQPFDPADYLNSEEGFAAYLADARLDGQEAFAEAVIVVDRARARMAKRAPSPAEHRAGAHR